MKLLDAALSAAMLLSAIVFSAYIALYFFDFGLFKILPPSIAGFFIRVEALQYVALGLFVAALIAKVPLRREIKRQEAETQI